MHVLKTLAVAAFFGVVALASQLAAAQTADDCQGSPWASGVVRGSDGAGGCSDAQVVNHALTVSATISGFTPNGNVASLAVSGVSANVALPSGQVVAVLNSGTTDANIKLSVGAGTAATTDFTLKGGATIGMVVGSNTFINAITASGTTNLSIAGGSGLVTGFGGGSSGTGGGAVTEADGANAALGSKADSASCTSTNTLLACIRQLDADVKSVAAIQGNTASGATLSENPLADGCLAKTASPTAVTDGQKVNALCDASGKHVTSPYAIKENWLAGTGSSTDTSAHTVIAAQGASIKIYVTDLECYRTDAGSTLIEGTVNDGATTPFGIPAGGEFMKTFNVPLIVAANTALQFTMVSGVTTAKCSAQGYKGP